MSPPSLASRAPTSGVGRPVPLWRPITRTSARASAGLRVSRDSFMLTGLLGPRLVREVHGATDHLRESVGGLVGGQLGQRNPSRLGSVASRAKAAIDDGGDIV